MLCTLVYITVLLPFSDMLCFGTFGATGGGLGTLAALKRAKTESTPVMISQQK